MKKFAVMLLASGIVSASAATAAPVARTADLRLTVRVQNLGQFFITAANQTVITDSEAGTLGIAAGAFVQIAPITVPITPTTYFKSVRAFGIGNLSGTFSIGGGAVSSPTTELPCATPVPVGIGCVTGGGGNLGGQMPLVGTVFVVVLPMLVSIPIPLHTVGIGVGGFNRIPNTPAGFLFDAAPFTTGIGKLGFTATSKTTWMGQFQGNPLTLTYTMSWQTVASTTGGNGGTAPSGTITLVSPTYLSALGNLLPVWTTLRVHFIPEPGTLLLLGAGIGGLVLVGRRRR